MIKEKIEEWIRKNTLRTSPSTNFRCYDPVEEFILEDPYGIFFFPAPNDYPEPTAACLINTFEYQPGKTAKMIDYAYCNTVPDKLEQAIQDLRDYLLYDKFIPGDHLDSVIKIRTETIDEIRSLFNIKPNIHANREGGYYVWEGDGWDNDAYSQLLFSEEDFISELDKKLGDYTKVEGAEITKYIRKENLISYRETIKTWTF